MVPLVALLCLFVLVFARIPIAFSMGIVGFVGFGFVVNFSAAAAMVTSIVYESSLSIGLSVLPLFVLMGNLVSHAGLSRDLYDASNSLIGHYRGGLAIATIFACGGFSAVCGSSLATAATMSKVAFPAMRKYGYSDSLAGGAIAAGGTLGILIPPSVLLVLYGLLTEQSIGKLFIAGIVPGILGILLYALAISVVVHLDPAAGPRGSRCSWNQRVLALKKIWGIAALFILVMGGIYGGAFTPTEAGAIGAVGALVFSVLRNGFNFKFILITSIETVRVTSMLFAVLIGALIFANFINITALPTALMEVIGSVAGTPFLVMIVILAVYLLLGCVLESISMITLTVPLFFPVVSVLGYDLIWFGIIVVVVTEISFLTPPIGLNIFVLKSTLPDVSTKTLFRGVFPFFVSDVVRLGLILVFPGLALLLPSLMK